jgi:uncharacterized protein (DUF362 family)
VVVKPNWVMHANKGPWGLEPLVTHASLIRSVCEALLRTSLGELTVGDAPLQSCDFRSLLQDTGLESWADELAGRDSRFRGIERLLGENLKIPQLKNLKKTTKKEQKHEQICRICNKSAVW